MSLAATIKAMAATGCSAKQIAAVAEAHEAEVEEAAAAKRAKSAARKARWRANNVHACPRDATGRDGTNGDTPSPLKERSPTPPKENNPLTPRDLRSLSSVELSTDANVIDLPRVDRRKPDDTELLQTIAGLWNETARSIGLPEIESLSDKRVSTLRSRIRQLGDFGLADDPLSAFRRWAANIRGSPFLHGKSGSWRADFDFAISPKGFVKIMENAYAGQQSSGFNRR